MKSKTSKETPLIDFAVHGEEVIFSAGGEPRFRVKIDTLQKLLSPDFLARSRAAAEQIDAFRGLDSLSTFVTMQRRLKQGYSSGEAARLMGIDAELFRKYLAFGLSKFGKDVQLIQNETTRQAKDEGDYCLKGQRRQTEQERARGIAPEPEYELVMAAQVKDMIAQSRSHAEICERFNLDKADFERWAKVNEALLV